jgi:hypothetical protein
MLVRRLGFDTARHIHEEKREEQLEDLTAFENPEAGVAQLGVTGSINFSKSWAYYVSNAYLGFGRGFDRQTNDSWSLFDLRLGIPMGRVCRITIGKFKEQFSTERLMGGGVMAGIERAPETVATTPPLGVPSLSALEDVAMHLR